MRRPITRLISIDLWLLWSGPKVKADGHAAEVLAELSALVATGAAPAALPEPRARTAQGGGDRQRVAFTSSTSMHSITSPCFTSW